MQDFSEKIDQSKRDWLVQFASREGIPAHKIAKFFQVQNWVIGRLKRTVKDAITMNGSVISLPMNLAILEDFISGFQYVYREVDICNDDDRLLASGFWEQEPDDPWRIIIYYDSNESVERQLFTKTHEFVHFMQVADDVIATAFDILYEEGEFTADVLNKIADRSANKVTASFLMPNEFFTKKYLLIKGRKKLFGNIEIIQIAREFGVSFSAAKIRLKECKLEFVNQQLSLK